MTASPHDRTEDRIEQLEIKLSYTEDLLDTLNDLVIKQQDHIDWLLREVTQLRSQRQEDVPREFRSLRDDLPPHY